MSEYGFDKLEIDLDRLVEQAVIPADEFLYRLLSEQENKVYSFAEMLAPQPPPEWTVNGLLLPGSVAVFAGAPGSKKTWCLLNLAVCVASGLDWLGHPTRQVPVLIVDEESGKRRLSNRLRKVVYGLGLDADSNLLLYASVMAGFDLRSDDGATALQNVIQLTRAGLVIIDALADVAPGADENAVKDMLPVMLNLRRIAEELDVAICLIHHTNKANGQYRGSSAIAGAVDLLVTIKSEAGEALVQFEIDKTRDGEPGTFYGMAQWDSFADTFTLNPVMPGKLPKFSPAEREIIRFLGETEEADSAQIAEAVKSVQPATTRRLINVLTEGGWLEKANTTGGGRGQRAVYRLSERGEDVYRQIHIG